MTRSNKPLYVSLIIGLLQLPYASMVPGQEAGFTGIEEIVVTARKREERLQDAPISISAFTAQGLAARGVADISQIGAFTPNMEFDFTSPIAANNTAASIYIRGIGELDWALPVDPGVGIYIDGVYVARSIGAVMDILEVERIEVLKGPQGTLFGRNTIGGAVSITTKKPGGEKEARATVTTGSDDRLDVRFYWNQPLSDGLYASVSGARRTRDGYVENLTPGFSDLGDDDVSVLRGALRWTPAEDLEMNFSVDWTREREAPAPNVLLSADETAFLPFVYNGGIPVARFDAPAPAACTDATDPSRLSNPGCWNTQFIAGPFKTFATNTTTNPLANTLAGRPAEPSADLDLWGVSFDAEWDLSDNLTVRSISAYRELDGFWTRDPDHSPLSLYVLPNAYDQEQFTQEVQLLGRAFGERMNWIAGVYYFDEEGCHIDGFEGPGFLITSGGCVDNDSLAVYGQGTYDVTDQLSLTLGVRWTDENKRYAADSVVQQDTLFGFPPGALVLPTEQAKTSATEVVPYVNLAYRWTEDLMTYASYTEGFKGGGFTQRVFPPLPATPSFRPEFVETYEIGFKSTWSDRKLRLNAAAFYTDYKDLQVNIVEGVVGAIIRQNAAKAEVKGFELEINAVPNENLLFEAGIGFLDASYEEFDARAQAAGLNTDLEFINTPEWTASAGLSYRIPVTSYWVAVPRVDWSYRAKVYNDAANSPLIAQDGYSLVHLGVRLESIDDKWTVMIRGTNITDKTYLVTGISAANDGFTGFAEGVYGRPAEWELSLQYNFF